MLSQGVTTLSHESIDKFRVWLFVRGKSEQTVKAYSTDLKMFLLATETPVDQQEYEELSARWLTMNRNKVSPKTTARRLTSLKAFARWAGWGPVLEDYRRPEAAKSMPHPLPEGIEGVRRLIQCASNNNQRALIALCGLCGCRIAEALAVVTTDFNTADHTLKIKGKGSKYRIVPVSKEAWEVLEVPIIKAWSENRPVVNLQDRQARKIITNLGMRANLRRRISSHDLRATFATEIYNSTLDIRVVQELLGHSSSVTTEIYVGVAMTKLRQAVEM